jgi:hypothetical protein
MHRMETHVKCAHDNQIKKNVKTDLAQTPTIPLGLGFDRMSRFDGLVKVFRRQNGGRVARCSAQYALLPVKHLSSILKKHQVTSMWF